MSLLTDAVTFIHEQTYVLFSLFFLLFLLHHFLLLNPEQKQEQLPSRGAAHPFHGKHEEEQRAGVTVCSPIEAHNAGLCRDPSPAAGG